MKKLILIGLLLVALVVVYIAWVFAGPGTDFKASKEFVYIRSSAATKQAVLDSLEKNHIVRHNSAFLWLANRMDYWKNIRPGRYEVKKGTSLLTLVRLLKNGHQSPVNLVITKLRTKEDLARFIGRRFETDSATMIRFLDSPDSLRPYGTDSSLAICNVIPDTYTLFWNSGPGTIYKKFSENAHQFWTSERKQNAAAHNLTPQQAYILASILEEETNNQAEKGNIASVYLNRIKKGMPLQADPTIKYAMRDFSLKRIYEKYLFIESPYNTYRNKGLPPGPICTPSRKTIDAVLNSPQTDYLYFVANSNFNGTHKFSATYEEHMQNAKAYQQALNHIDSLTSKH